MEAIGSKRWLIADGWLPAKETEGNLDSHEALMILNTSDKQADIELTIFFEDKPPVKGITFSVEPERVKCVRLDHPEELQGCEIPPLTQYALMIKSSEKVGVQFGRLDATQSNLAYYGCTPISG